MIGLKRHGNNVGVRILSTKLYAIIRLRGKAGIDQEVEDTLRMLRLTRKHCCVIYPATREIEGMLMKVKDWVTWGEIDFETLIELLKNRGRIQGGKPLSNDYLKKVLGIESIELFAKELMEGKMLIHKLDEYGIKPVFRLHPPRKGFKGSIKKPYKDGGELGYRGKDINDLIKRMI